MGGWRTVGAALIVAITLTTHAAIAAADPCKPIKVIGDRDKVSSCAVTGVSVMRVEASSTLLVVVTWADALGQHTGVAAFGDRSEVEDAYNKLIKRIGWG